MKKEQQDIIRETIQNIMCELTNLEQIIEDSYLTKSQKKWALKNLDWKVIII